MSEWQAKLAELAAMEDGWGLDGDEPAPNAFALNAAERIARDLESRGIPFKAPAPDVMGGVAIYVFPERGGSAWVSIDNDEAIVVLLIWGGPDSDVDRDCVEFGVEGSRRACDYVEAFWKGEDARLRERLAGAISRLASHPDPAAAQRASEKVNEAMEILWPKEARA